MGNAHLVLHKCASRAHLWSPPPGRDPVLCRTRSTFPPMTTGTIWGILESVRAVGTAPGWVRKGRDHERAAKHTVAGGAGRRKALRLLWRCPPGRARFGPTLVAGGSAAGGHELWCGPVSGLPPAQHGSSQRRLCQRSALSRLWAIATPTRPRHQTLNTDSRGRKGRAASLACPPLQAWADGHRNHL